MNAEAARDKGMTLGKLKNLYRSLTREFGAAVGFRLFLLDTNKQEIGPKTFFCVI